MRRSSWLTLTAAVTTLGLVAPQPGVAQTSDQTGLVPAGLLLRQLDGVKRVLMIGAHPDDEDTSLLATLARGWGVQTAYLSLTRGDGGQNLIGPELWEGLGIVRTGELLAARGLDGGAQFFTRAFDYGFSKSADEALSIWPREELLEDVVWVIRTFRPQVIVSVFSGTPLDGHGQHQAAGIMAREAFAAAADPDRFPEQLAQGVDAWAADKLYQTSRRRFFSNAPDEDDGSLDVQTGALDPLLGRSLYQVAMDSRSQHRSQDMGTAQPWGPRLTGVLLVESRVDDLGQAIFSGIDTTLVGRADALPAGSSTAVGRHLAAYRAAVAQAGNEFGLDPARVVPSLLTAAAHLRQAREAAPMGLDRELDVTLAHKQEVLGRALRAAAGVAFSVRSVDDLVVPGETVRVRALLWNGGSVSLTAARPSLAVPASWVASEVATDGVGDAGEVEPGTVATWDFDVTVPDDAELSRLYYLRTPRDGGMYAWPDDPSLWGAPRDPAAVEGRLTFEFAGEARAGVQEARAPWRYVQADPAFGEFQRPVLVVPAVSVSVSPRGIAWPQGRTGDGTISVVVRSEAADGSRAGVGVEAPDGWTVTPASADFALDQPGAERTLQFTVRPDASVSAGRHLFRVTATTETGQTFAEGFELVDYEHIDRAALFRPAEAVISVVPVRVADGLRVGYVMGSGDDGPEALRQMGAEVELLDEAAVRQGRFADFSSVVLGVRAYETREDLRSASEQLLDFARAGGTVVVQYNRGPLGALAPFTMTVGRGSPRVSDETAPVRLLDASSPVFTTPNRITSEDFEGWVQERGLYFASEWDDRYTPLLELNDPGEDPRQGALLVAPVGDGAFVYVALSFFRQWAGQVPGAYRLFANLISLDGRAWAAHHR